MKTMRSSILCFVVLLLAGPLLRAQDLSKYRHFTVGMSMTRVLERTGQKMADVTEGLTEEDMVKSISAKYGPPTYVALAIDYAPNDRHGVTQTPVASWEDTQYSFNLVRSSFSDHLGLVIYSKRVNGEAELAIAEAVKLEEQEGPNREAERQKKQTDDLEVARQKNRKIFRP